MFAGNLKLDEDVKLAHQKAPVLPSHKKKKRNRKKKKVSAIQIYHTTQNAAPKVFNKNVKGIGKQLSRNTEFI